MSTDTLTDTVGLWLGLADEEPGFRDTLRRIAWPGLIIGGVLGVTSTLIDALAKTLVLGHAVAWTWWGDLPEGSVVLMMDKLVTSGLSLSLIVAGWRRCSLTTGRVLLGVALPVASAASLTTDLLKGTLGVEYVTLMFFATVAVVPYRPWQTAVLGGSITGVLYAAGTYGPTVLPWQPVDGVVPAESAMIQTGVLCLLMVAVSGLLYVSRYRQYRNRRAAEKLRDEVAELEASKSRFFANVSHELRTPLTVILGPLEDALDGRYGALPDRLREPLGAMKDQAERLRTLVDQLLRLSKLDEGRMDLDARPIALGPFLQRMASLFSSMADRKQIEVRVEAEGDPHACADPEALKQIVSNLLSNALEHTPENGLVRLKARPARDDELPTRDGAPPNAAPSNGTARTVVSVRDSGPGLPKEVQGDLFDRYVGAGAQKTDPIDVSTGIGLAVVKELAERHGGSVKAESEPDFGTEIVAFLPADCQSLPAEDVTDEDESDASLSPEPAVQPEVEPEGEPAPDRAPGIAAATNLATADASSEEDSDGSAGLQPGVDRPDVLVVDDEAGVRDYLREVLTPRYAVRTAPDGEDALSAARDRVPDLIISDVVMPRRDGYALCRAVRADDRLRGVPVVLLTVQDEQEDRLEGLREGADAYVGKPFHPEELRQRVENLIGIRRYLQQQGRSRSTRAPASSNGSSPDEPSGDASTVDDQAVDADASTAEGDHPSGPDSPSVGDDRVGSESAFLQEVRSVVEEHVGNSSFGVEWLADEVDLSTRQLQRRLQDEIGLSAAAYIRAIRLDHAARLLETGEVTTVTDAASAVGYRDPSYFSQLFKEAHGVSPSDLK